MEEGKSGGIGTGMGNATGTLAWPLAGDGITISRGRA
jgi:hypothetical protein